MMRKFLFTIFFVFGLACGKSYSFLSPNLCTGEAPNCGNSSDSRCQEFTDGYCSCIDPSLDLDVAIMLDATKSVSKKIWNNIIKVLVNYLDLIVIKEPNANVTIYIFGDNEINSYKDSNSLLSLDYPDYSSATTCNALQTIGRNLQNTFYNNKVVWYIAWKTPSDVNDCDLSLLNGTNLYTFKFNNANLGTFKERAESSGMQYTEGGYCNSACVNFVKLYSGDLTGYTKMAAGYLGSWTCKVAQNASTAQPLSTLSSLNPILTTNMASTNVPLSTSDILGTAVPLTSASSVSTFSTNPGPEPTVSLIGNQIGTTQLPVSTSNSTTVVVTSKYNWWRWKHIWKKILSIFS